MSNTRAPLGGIELSGLYKKHELADVGARLHHPMRFGGSGQWIGGMHERPQVSRFDQRPDVLTDLARNGRFLCDRPRT